MMMTMIKIQQQEFEDEPAERQRRRSHDDDDDDDDDDVEYGMDENPTHRAAAAAAAASSTKSLAPLEMDSSSNENGNNHSYYGDDSDDDQHHDGDDEEAEDAVSLLGSETGAGAATAGDFYSRHSNSNASTDGASSYSSGGRRSASGAGARRGGINRYRYINSDGSNNNRSDITLREMAAVQGKTCFPVYFCAVILLILLVAAIFVAPPPPDSSTPTTPNPAEGDSHYRSPASSAAQEQEQQQQKLQCELNITGGADTSSWDAYVQSVSSNPSFDGNRCFIAIDQPTNTPCLCANPTVPDFPHEPASYAQKWQETFQQNLDRIALWEAINSASAAQAKLDVVFLGDSITEHWVGTDLSVSKPQRWSGNVRVFQSLFGNVASLTEAASNRSPTTNLLGMAMGISGDRCPNLLYRVQNGELLPLSLQPSMFWILIGTNDVGGSKCLASQVIAGTIAIIKYIQQERPNARIVVNSILPCGYDMNYWREMYQPINQAMECFVQGFQKQQRDSKNDEDNDDGNDHGHGELYFFNATDLFLTADKQSINYTLLPDRLHPGEEGSWIWGRAMVEKIQDILAT
jgi:lysophospholipase L1-like esterase